MYNPYQPQFSMYQNTPIQQNILPQQQIMQTNGKPTFDTFRMSPKNILKKVCYELKKAERKLIELQSVSFDLILITEEQDKIHDKYKEKIKRNL